MKLIFDDHKRELTFTRDGRRFRHLAFVPKKTGYRRCSKWKVRVGAMIYDMKHNTVRAIEASK